MNDATLSKKWIENSNCFGPFLGATKLRQFNPFCNFWRHQRLQWIGNSWIDAIDFFFSCVVSYWISDLAAVTVLCFFKKKNSFTVCGGRERRGRKEKTKLNEETERKEVLWGSGEGLIMDYTCSRARMSIGSMFSSFLTLFF